MDDRLLVLRRFAPALPAVVALLLSGCATNPATGERQLSLIPESQEIQMGRQAAQQVRQTIGLADDASLQQYVDRVGQQLAAASERPDLPWSFAVVDDPTPNAFALPGGFIFVTRGLMNLLTSEAELASVLGHEIGHVTARHSVNQMSKQQIAQLGLGIGSVLAPEVEALSPAIGAGLNLLFLKYSRDDEREADELGFQYIREQHYEVSEFADVFSALQRAAGGDGAVPGWLSTHPAPAERVEIARQRAARVGAQPQAVVGREAYLRRLDGLIYGENPRHGFFRDNVFYQPELGFRVAFPRGWQAQNLAQAVVAAAPQDPAAFQLTLAPGTPQQALQRFAQQQAVQVGRPVRGALSPGGLSAEFLAQTSQGTVRGIAAFLEHRGRTYQLLGYGAQSRYSQLQPMLTDIIRSFEPISDPDVLRLQPMRIDIIEIDRRQTLREFADRYHSAVPAEQLAVINQVANASTPLPAGTLVKRVVS
jgi:predicted Zn-dependent protease